MGLLSRIKKTVSGAYSKVKSIISKPKTTIKSISNKQSGSSGVASYNIGGKTYSGGYSVAPSSRTSSSSSSSSGSTSTVSKIKNTVSKVAGAVISPSVVGPVSLYPKTTLSKLGSKVSGFFSSNTYKALDYGAFGLLPGGLSRTEVKALSTGVKATDTAFLAYEAAREAQAAQDLANAKAQLDVYDESVMDKIKGLFSTTPEEQVQEALTEQAAQQALEAAGLSAEEAGQRLSGTKPSTTNWWLIGGVAVVALILGGAFGKSKKRSV